MVVSAGDVSRGLVTLPPLVLHLALLSLLPCADRHDSGRNTLTRETKKQLCPCEHRRRRWKKYKRKARAFAKDMRTAYRSGLLKGVESGVARFVAAAVVLAVLAIVAIALSAAGIPIALVGIPIALVGIPIALQ